MIISTADILILPLVGIMLPNAGIKKNSLIVNVKKFIKLSTKKENKQKRQPLTINKKFNYFIILLDNLTLFFLLMMSKKYYILHLFYKKVFLSS
jgi:hypothetical protein